MFVPDFGNNTVALFDAYADTHPFPWLRLRVGKFKGPVGLERLQSDADIVFVERALPQNLSPQREVGVELWGDIAGGVVRYEAGVFNGNPDNGNNDIDSNHAKTFEGRLVLQPFSLPSLHGLGRLLVGVAASTGNELGTATNPWVGAFKSFSQSTIFSYLATSTANTVFAKGRHTRVNPQLYYYFGPFGLLAEWVHEHQGLANSVGTGALNNSAGNVVGLVRHRRRRDLRRRQAAPQPRPGVRRLRRAGDRRPLQLARHRPGGLPHRGQSADVGQPGAGRSAWRWPGS